LGCSLLEPGVDPEFLGDSGREVVYQAQMHENVPSIALYRRCPGRGVVIGSVLSCLRLTLVNYYRRGGFYFYHITGLVRSPSLGERLGGWGLICAFCM